jgi:hypothetical protein
MTDKDELLRTAKTERTKALKFDGEAEDGERITWFVAYRGNYGWVGCRGDGSWMDEPDEEEIEHAVDEYNTVELVDRSDLPAEVNL